ncbi:MAG: DUF2284 domain-containing protein [Oscillospiraceae bacterium]|jgi:predicted metal-binding protein|nr:DUF2284 domain-containing protein [Oscillospiraceae bacterium]
MKKYIKLAKSLGADNVVKVTPKDIVFDGRTILKCMFGCGSWGKGCTCPSRPGFLSSKEYEELLRKYKVVLIIHSTSKVTSQKVSFEIEKEAFLSGDVLAFSMSDCALCESCAGYTDEPCRNVKMARPSFHSVGIDVFATVKKLGLPLEVLSNPDEEQQNWYSAIWLN